MSVKEVFKKYYDMKPYLQIEEDEWQHIIKTYEKDMEWIRCIVTFVISFEILWC